MRSLYCVFSSFVTVLALLYPGTAPGAPSVLINEVMYHPVGTNRLEQWFELFNPGTTNVDLSGWRITKGVGFVFPTNTLLASGAYLVVAANSGTFAGQHPEVNNVVAGWTGTLGHSLELSDAAGKIVNAVSFSDEGDWAIRVLGAGGVLGASDDFDGLGWEWVALHDGGGASLELRNPGLPNELALNWGANRNTNSTPGRANSLLNGNLAPIVTEVNHLPILPHSTDPVIVTARLVDEQTAGLDAKLHWRLDGTAAFAILTMQDDGQHGDGVANDGVFGALIPPQADRAIVEFFITATDPAGNSRTYPDWKAPADSPRTANLLYQVDEGTYSGNQPIYRLIMTEAERAYLEALSTAAATTDSDAEMNGTWITSDGVLANGLTTQLRYNVGIRNRGHGSRRSRPHNFHLNIPGDRKWKGQTGLNLNSQYAHSQVLGSAVFRRLGVPMADSRAVQLRVNGVNQMELSLPNVNSFGSYAANEQYNDDFVQRTFPLDPSGNSYRGIRDPQAGVNSDADFVWHGPEIAQGVYTNAYFKQNHLLENDWSDLITLLGILNEIPGYSSAATYVADVERVVAVDEWMRYFALNALLSNEETSPANGIGDDYALYRGQADQRFLLLPYDADSLMGRGLTATAPANSLFRMLSLSAMNRFVKTAEFAPRYYYWLKTFAQGAFSPAQMDGLLDQLFVGWVPQATVDNYKAFNRSRTEYVLSQIPQALTVSSTLAVQNGYPRTTVGTVLLSGEADATATRSIRVNGALSAYSAWEGRWTNASVIVRPGVNHLLVQAFDAGGKEIGRATYDVWYDDGNTTSAGGAITSSVLWSPANGPYQVTASLAINSGATLTIAAGTCVFLASGVDVTVANGGRLLVQGTSNAPVLFTRAPTSSAAWGGILINGGAGSPETSIAWTHITGNGSTAIHSTGGTVLLDHLTFGALDHQYLSLDASSFIVRHCVFPSPTAQMEPVHGTGGIKAGGHGIFYRNFHGKPIGYNDVVDFTGGNRPGGPVVHFLDSVFIGATDDILDLDGTDAWVEGNIFLHVHKNGSPDSASAVSGGDDSSHTSQITIINNLFYDVDQAATAKLGNFYTFLNNTVVHQTKIGGLDTDAGVLGFADEGIAVAAGMYVEGNIIVDAEKLTRYLTPGSATANATTFTNNLMPFAWAGAGGRNSTNAPLLKHIPSLAETEFATWEEAQVMREWLSLLPGSPAAQAGPNRTDLGGVRPLGISISGEPGPTNQLRTATLVPGINRSGSGIPAAGWPAGSGYTHYKWRLDGGAWSGETPIASPIQLNSLTDGPHQVEVTGKRDTELYQDDPRFGELALATFSHSWVVDPNFIPTTTPKVRINEVLAVNGGSFLNAGTTPDLVELYNYGSTAVDLAGMGLTDAAGSPYKFTFPANTLLGAGAYLTLLADSATTLPGVHMGFSLKQNGDDLTLTDAKSRGGSVIDQVAFGLQISDASIGRGGDGEWVLCRPTFGAANAPVATGDSRRLMINEWLTDAEFVADNDFVELFNPETSPVGLGGLFLSDAGGSPLRYPIPPLSFISGLGFTKFVADADPAQGADHVNFKLAPDVGVILLTGPDQTLIDVITYGPQRTDISEGRSPSGGEVITRFDLPSPGSANPGISGGGECTVTTQTVELFPLNTSWRYNQTANLDGVFWFATNYNDASWANGPALLAFEDCNCLPAPGIQTSLTKGKITYYFRKTFVVNTNVTGFTLNFRTVFDDGAVVYLNGIELFRVDMPDGTIGNSTRADRNVDDATLGFVTAAATRLRQGTNVLAVEVHQSSSSSTDLAFGLGLELARSITNCEATVSLPVVLNEILAENHSYAASEGRTADWVELVNLSTNTVDLAGVSLSDDAGFPRKWSFPNGASILPRGYLTVLCDAGLPPSAGNTGFGLGGKGGAVYLFDKPSVGGALVDGVRYGLQTPDLSIGRIPNGNGAWTLTLPSPSAVNTASGLASPSALRINEWMADPASGNDWFEVYNTANQPIALGGLALTDNLTDRFQHRIAPLSFIGTDANAFVAFVADGAPDQGPEHVNFSLKKSGESLGLFSPLGLQLDAIAFGVQTTGVSQGRLPDGDVNLVAFAESPTPGGSNFQPLENAVINEVLAHTDLPLEDAIELRNPSAVDVNIGGWYLSNSSENFRKFRIPANTILPAGGFVAFYERDFNVGSTAFTFNAAHGDEAILSQADAAGSLSGYRARVSFGASANGVSFGRYASSIGVDFTAMEQHTLGHDNPASVAEFRLGQGAANSGPKVGPVVISEIMYYSTVGGVEKPGEEFVELENLSGLTVPLFDPVSPTNAWHLRDAVEFTFPSGTTLAPFGHLLVVDFDPADSALVASFRAKFEVSPDVPVFGPWVGQLANDADSVELVMPDPVQLAPHPDAGFVPQVLVDKVRYQSVSPWPADASLGLNSLQRLIGSDYANDPVNWRAATPTAGRSNGTSPDPDSDHDEMLDAWELENFGSLERDGAGDLDGDGVSDLNEYLSGTDPKEAGSRFRLEVVSHLGTSCVLRFEAVAGRTYTVSYRDAVEGREWVILAEIPRQAAPGPILVTDETVGGSDARFYRVATP